MSNNLTNSQKILTILLPFCGGYFLSYVFRSTNAVIAPKLINDIGLSSEQLGMLTSSYLLTFALFQIPLGILLDKLGPRKVQIYLMLIAAVGALFFSQGQTLMSLTISRAIIGLGVAGCLMSTFKIITLWYDKEYWPMLYGICLSSGGFGAIAATKPLDFTVESLGWRGAFILLAILCCMVSFIIWLITPEKKLQQDQNNSYEVLKNIYLSKNFIRIAPLAGFTGGSALAIQGLWAGEWLRDVGNLDQNETTNVLLVLNISLLCGMISIGFLPNLLKRFNFSQINIYIFLTSLLIISQIILTFNLIKNSLVPWIILGVSANGAILVYSWLNSKFPISYAGRTSTAINLSLFLCGFLLQYVIGWIISFWDRLPNGSYPSVAYSYAFGTILVLQIICFILFFLLKNKYMSSNDNKII